MWLYLPEHAIAAYSGDLLDRLEHERDDAQGDGAVGGAVHLGLPSGPVGRDFIDLHNHVGLVDALTRA